jgi:hypothetical protein
VERQVSKMRDLLVILSTPQDRTVRAEYLDGLKRRRTVLTPAVAVVQAQAGSPPRSPGRVLKLLDVVQARLGDRVRQEVNGSRRGAEDRLALQLDGERSAVGGAFGLAESA